MSNFIRWLRSDVSRFIYWQWKTMGRLSATLYHWIHERINGK